MAYPKLLNEQYKAEKAAGKTLATSFPEWNALRLQAVEVVDQTPIIVDAPTDGNKPIDDILAVTSTVLDIADQTVKVSKAALARQLYDAEVAKFAADNKPVIRKTIIDLFKSTIGLTDNGAATYYQNIRREKGLISS
jgi:hypothetical protein